MNEITWYDWIDGEGTTGRKARQLKGCPRLTSTQLEVLYQMRKTVGDGYVISKANRDQLFDMGLVDRLNGWQFITRLGMAVLDVYGLLSDDRYGCTNTPYANFIQPQQWTRLHSEGWIRD